MGEILLLGKVAAALDGPLALVIYRDPLAIDSRTRLSTVALVAVDDRLDEDMQEEAMEECIARYLDMDATEAAHLHAAETLRSHAHLLALPAHPLMRAALTSEDERLRYRSTLLLCDLLDAEETSLFAPDHASVHSLLAFFTSRLGDYPSVVPCIKGIHTLVRTYSAYISRTDVAMVFSSIFAEVPVQSVAQSIRQRVFDLFLLLFQNRILVQHSQDIGVQVVKGVTASIHGEKDPRCLVLCFRLMNDVLRLYSSSVHESMVGDVFETVACYFPITFVPPADDPHGITAEMLIGPLNECLCNHSVFVTYSMPFLLDQLSAESLHASKMQALDCIVASIKVHGFAPFIGLLRQLAEDLYGLNSSAPPASDLSQRVLATVTELCRLVARDLTSSGSSESWFALTEVLMRKVQEDLSTEDIDGVQAIASIRIACAIAKSSFTMLDIVLSKMFTTLASHIYALVAYVRSDCIRSSAADDAVTPPSPNCLAFTIQLLECIDSRIDYSALFLSASSSIASQGRGILDSLIRATQIEALATATQHALEASVSVKTLLIYSSILECIKEFLLR